MLSIKPRQRAGEKGGIFSRQHNSLFQSYFGEKNEKRRGMYVISILTLKNANFKVVLSFLQSRIQYSIVYSNSVRYPH